MSNVSIKIQSKMNNDKIEICRSFSRTVQVNPYEPASFFCSAKKEVLAENVAETSKVLDTLCQNEVTKSIKEFEDKLKPQPKTIQSKTEKYEKSNDIGWEHDN